ncbi:hypothetical protein PI125_g114 [Phytophthora idaei]|nr:hypothetical protein PI125_g114 [Phytophthora idaei]
MPSASAIASRFGATSPPSQIPLYVCSAINNDAEATAQHFDPMTNQRRDYYIGLFHELRRHVSKKTSRKSKVPEWMGLGTPLLRASTETETRERTAPVLLRRNSASRLFRGVT